VQALAASQHFYKSTYKQLGEGGGGELEDGLMGKKERGEK
jgi:hypothetical protein